jgi:hypothetical protein
MGLDPALVAEAIADPTTGDEVLAEHQQVLALAGYGVPTLVFDDTPHGPQALFGPVLIDPPTGEDAVALWHAVTAWLRFPHVYELQRPKSRADVAAITEAFTPYLTARDWVTIQKDTP